MTTAIQRLNLADVGLAYQQARPLLGARKRAGVMFLSGYGSDMTGTKASFLDEWCDQAGVDYLRFDYRGCGLSSGTFLDGTIGDWLEDSLAMLDQVAQGPQLLVGSSMGGWLALLLATLRPDRVAGVLGLAAAPDFTKNLVWDRMTEAQKEEMKREGVIYEQGLPLTLKLIEEGANHLMLDKPVNLSAPLHLVQGMKDAEVPWSYALKIARKVSGPSARVTYLGDADHRLSRLEDLEIIGKMLGQILAL